jgi:3-oxoacyl-[acyl-carrier protein] reductase
MEKFLTGKTALVTGAARGIGKAIVKTLLEAGAGVAFSDMAAPEAIAETEKELSAGGGKVKGYRSDASDFNAAEKLITDVCSDFGTVDVMVNNAGITRDTLLMRMNEQQWDDVLRINLKSVFNLTKAVQKPMLKQRSGSIINMSSIVGVKGNAGQSNYSASKAGIIGFTKSIALELGSRNIRCNAIAPGFIATEMTGALSDEVLKQWQDAIPLKRAGTPQDVANLVLFLASDLSSYISGQVIQVDGGLLT